MSALKLAMNCGLDETGALRQAQRDACRQSMEQMELIAEYNSKQKELDELKAKVEQMEEENKKLKQDLGTKNVKGNRKAVITTYTLQGIHMIPDGIDLEDKSVVESWGVKWGSLRIKYVGKEEVEVIDAWVDAEDSHDFKWGNTEIIDADDVDLEYSEDEETDEETDEKTDEVKPFWEKPIERDENGNAIIEKKW
jgi:seryl-tRNA synthetase